MCLANAELSSASELANAMLQDVPAVLTKEIQKTRSRLKPDDDFLEVLRAENPWNFQFSVPQTQTLSAENLQQAAMELFYLHVLRSPGSAAEKKDREPPMSIRPRRMEAYEVAV
jgi:hypothetical protein